VDIELEFPLRNLVRGCATYCQIECCELDAFDVNAYSMLWWLRESTGQAQLVREQLEELIRRVAALQVPIRIGDYCHDWPDGDSCAQYLRTWLAEYLRALTIGPEGTPPAQRLREAAERGRSEYLSEVYRMSNETGWATNPSAGPEDRRRALAVLTALARLDPADSAVQRDVEYARRTLSEQGLCWQGDT
jgi:hypothetical protein